MICDKKILEEKIINVEKQNNDYQKEIEKLKNINIELLEQIKKYTTQELNK